jgi:hypothetical protein
VVKKFVDRHPLVRLSLHQGHPTQIAEWALKGEADIAIATEALDQYPQLVMLPCYQWVHCVIAPDGHPDPRREIPVADRPGALAADHLRSRLCRSLAHQQGLRAGAAGRRTSCSPRSTPTSSRPTSASASALASSPAWLTTRSATAGLQALPAEHLCSAEHDAHRLAARQPHPSLRVRLHRAVRAAADAQSGRHGARRCAAGGGVSAVSRERLLRLRCIRVGRRDPLAQADGRLALQRGVASRAGYNPLRRAVRR